MSTYALIKDEQVVNTVVWDGEGDIFEGYETVKIDGLGVGIGWTYDGKKFTAPPVPEPTHEELVQQAEIQKQALINNANNYIDSNQWPSKLALGRLKDDEKASFNKWLDYLDALESVDPSKAPEIVWPTI
ncbi:TPA: tail fiber assembly protein [Enterobacter cloacae]|nr:tail fiber assembly protein [Enterobacter cloacae]HEB0934120.1 tail fiber assembly protein [Enterobacter cloacae]HEB0949128.1 tail fiber assembly protein [Enterobacter cloacae]HEB0969272.1 tail fiber assembly protein [Enterobacter cloacae]